MKALVAIFFLFPGCLSRAPTTYELDRRSGLTPSPPTPEANQTKFEDNLQGARLSSQVEKRAFEPIRVPPLVEKIWVHDQQIGTHWLQGTWLYLEVEPSQWFDAIDPGSGSFAKTLPFDGSIKTRTRP